MASDNETVADIVREMRAYAKNSKVNGGEVDVWNWLADYAKRIAAAHKRELAAKDDERLTIVAIYENVIAAKDREIAELRDKLKVADDALRKLQERLVAGVYDGTIDPHEALKIAEDAIAAISEKGGAK